MDVAAFAAAPNVVTRLWRALVRPLLKFGCEVWAPQFTTAWLIELLENAVHTFARVCLHAPPHLAKSVLRGDLALQSVRSHQLELAMRFFGRMCATNTSDPDRLISRVLRLRHSEVRNGGAELSWIAQMRVVMQTHEFGHQWSTLTVGDAEEWTKQCRVKSNLRELLQWQVQSGPPAMRSLALYATLKEHLAPLPWYDRGGVVNAQGRRLKLLARANALDLAPRLASITRDSSPSAGSCAVCGSGEQESVQHFVMFCCALGFCNAIATSRVT